MIGYAVIDINTIEEHAKDHASWTDDNWRNYFYHHQSDISLFKNNKTYTMDPLKNVSDMRLLKGLYTHLNNTEQKMQVLHNDEFAVVLGYNSMRFVLPSDLVTVEPLEEYDHMSSYSIASVTGNGSLVTAPSLFGHDTKASLQSKETELQNAFSEIEQKAKDIEAGEAEELADIKAKMDALMEQMKIRQEELMKQLNAKKAEMEAKMAEYKKQMFMLETQIYGLRCYLGEVVSFYTVRDGKPAKINEPIVVYQKIRFLNEELGRYLALHNFGDYEDDKETFLEALKNREDIMELLAPGPKSISVAKISRTDTVKGGSDKAANMLENYEMYHKNQLVILIRNGEQLHMTWLDADKICLSSEDIFLTPCVTETEVEAEAEEQGIKLDNFPESIREQAHVRRFQAEQEKNREEMISRWFFFNILQGVLDNTNLVRIPNHVSITKEKSPYIIFSAADGWITTSGYGTFADLLAKSKDIPLRKGDKVLTGMRLTRDSGMYSREDDRWDNNRGIGDKNRTRGICLPGKEILTVNKVLPAIVVRYTAKIYKAKIVCDLKGDTMWRHEDGSISNWKHSDKDDFDHYLPTYTAELTDQFDHEETWEETIKPDTWHSYTNSVNKLTEADLFRISKENDHKAYTLSFMGNGRKIYGYDLKSVYEHTEPMYWLKFQSAKIIGETEHQYYVSVKQTGWGGGYNAWSNHETEYCVNFQFYLGEVIPLTFLCSTWVKDVIQSGHIGNVRLCGACMNFSDMLPYLKESLAHLQECEENEKAMLLAVGGKEWVENNPAWDVMLCEWKIKNQIHALTETRAKRFLKEKDCA